MSRGKPITIVGGGLAGLTLGIGLRQFDVPVTVVEAGRYPRHRVCGEFISGRGQETLSRLGLRGLLERAGAVQARTAAFFSGTHATVPRRLPADAICLSRYAMDHALAREFRRLCGELIEGERWKDGNFGEGVVRATGRRAQVAENGWRWFGLKAHASRRGGIALAADLEMHLLPHGHVGLCRVEGGEVNVCGLFRRPVNETSVPQDWREWLRGAAGSTLHRRLASAEFDERSFCAVGGLSLRPHRATARTECCVGDAITMIPPVAGNGMSMAFESGEMAIGPLLAWSWGETGWAQAQQTFACQCDEAFGRRLTWARWFQWMMFARGLQPTLLRLASRSNWFWRTTLARTR